MKFTLIKPKVISNWALQNLIFSLFKRLYWNLKSQLTKFPLFITLVFLNFEKSYFVSYSCGYPPIINSPSSLFIYLIVQPYESIISFCFKIYKKL